MQGHTRLNHCSSNSKQQQQGAALQAHTRPKPHPSSSRWQQQQGALLQAQQCVVTQTQGQSTYPCSG